MCACCQAHHGTAASSGPVCVTGGESPLRPSLCSCCFVLIRRLSLSRHPARPGPALLAAERPGRSQACWETQKGTTGSGRRCRHGDADLSPWPHPGAQPGCFRGAKRRVEGAPMLRRFSELKPVFGGFRKSHFLPKNEGSQMKSGKTKPKSAVKD